MLAKLLQLANAAFPMLVTLSGIVMLVNLSQLSNAITLIEFPLVITTLCKSVLSMLDMAIAGIVASAIGQPLNAFSPMLVTLSGIVMLVKLLQLANAYAPMLVTLSGIVMLVKLLQPLKVELPILVTLSGIVMLVKLLQLAKAELPMLVTLSGIAILVRLLQF